MQMSKPDLKSDAVKERERERERKRAKVPSPPLPRSIILDTVKASDLQNLNLIFCCEQCSYFAPDKGCAMGFRSDLHRRENQLRLFELTGKMAFCRSQEVD